MSILQPIVIILPAAIFGVLPSSLRHALMPIIIFLLVVWAIYHSVAEMKQDKRIDQLEREIKKTAAGD